MQYRSIFESALHLTKWTFTYDIHTDGGVGRQTIVLKGCVTVVVTMGGGVENPAILRTSYVNGPQL